MGDGKEFGKTASAPALQLGLWAGRSGGVGQNNDEGRTSDVLGNRRLAAYRGSLGAQDAGARHADLLAAAHGLEARRAVPASASHSPRVARMVLHTCDQCELTSLGVSATSQSSPYVKVWVGEESPLEGQSRARGQSQLPPPGLWGHL